MTAVSRTALAFLALGLSTGCKRAASLEGDIEITQSGQVRKGIGQTVFLLRNGDSVMQAVDRACASWKTRMKERAERASEFDARAARFRRASERASMIRSVALLDSVDKYRQAAAAERRAQSEDSPLEQIKELVRAAVDTHLQADLEGHYQVRDLTPGTYTLYAEWLSDQDYRFWATVPVGKGESKKQNLDQTTLATARFSCQ